MRDIRIGQKCHNTFPDVDVNALNDKFININVSNPDSSIYDDFCFVPLGNPFSFQCVYQLEVLKCLSSVRLNTIGVDDLDRLYLKTL